MAPRITGRDGAVLVGVLIVILGVVWGTARVAQLSADRDRLQSQVNTLANQVRGLGGTPRVTPQPGPTGAAGPPGSSVTGPPGRQGPSGRSLTGPQGASGKPGASVTGPAGVAGSPGAVGPSGPSGPAGPAGRDGSDGRDGKDGSPPSSFTWTYLGVTYTCTPTSDGATTYTCEPS